MSGCGCHGGDGIAHVTCLVRMARMATVEDVEKGFYKWQACFECEQSFHGGAQLALGWACWKEYGSCAETNMKRCGAMLALAVALRCVDAAAAVRVLKVRLATIRRFWPMARQEIIGTESTLANALHGLGRKDEALHLRRSVYADQLAFCGPDHENTILEANNVVVALVIKGLVAEAKQLARKTYGDACRVLGDKHAERIRATEVFARCLYSDPTARQADVLEAEALLASALATARHALGPQHPITVKLVENLGRVRHRLRETA